jgi:hypothetical protein
MFLESRCVGLTTLALSVSWLSGHCGILNISEASRPPQPVTGIAVLLCVYTVRISAEKQFALVFCSVAPVLQVISCIITWNRRRKLCWNFRLARHDISRSAFHESNIHFGTTSLCNWRIANWISQAAIHVKCGRTSQYAALNFLQSLLSERTVTTGRKETATKKPQRMAKENSERIWLVFVQFIGGRKSKKHRRVGATYRIHLRGKLRQVTRLNVPGKTTLRSHRAEIINNYSSSVRS